MMSRSSNSRRIAAPSHSDESLSSRENEHEHEHGGEDVGELDEPFEPRTRSGLRRAVAPVAPETERDVVAPPPPALPMIPGLPTPDELQIAAQKRMLRTSATPISPLSPILVVSNGPFPPRPFLPPASVRRAFIAQMQASSAPPPRSLWPWLTAGVVFAVTGILLGAYGLGYLRLPF